MLEFIVIIVCLSVIIVGLIIGIPAFVKLHTEADANPDHIYTIFNRESGPRGMHISSVCMITMPLVLLSSPPTEILYIFIFLVFAAIALYFHLPVYKGYDVLNNKMRRILLSLIGVLIALAILAKYDVINSNLYIALNCFISFYWGGLAVYKRSKLIKHNQQLHRTP